MVIAKKYHATRLIICSREAERERERDRERRRKRKRS